MRRLLWALRWLDGSGGLLDKRALKQYWNDRPAAMQQSMLVAFLSTMESLLAIQYPRCYFQPSLWHRLALKAHIPRRLSEASQAGW